MSEKTSSQQIDDIITLHGGWKGETLSQIRAAIKQADPNVVEEVKWKMPSRPEGLPVWYHNGIMCLAETFKDNIKLVFTKGAQIEDLAEYFNARLNSKTDRAIEFKKDDKVNAAVVQKVVTEAVRLNELKEN